MNTRIRAIIVTAVTSLVVFLGLVDIFSIRQILLGPDANSEIVAEFLSAGFISLLLTIGSWWTIYFKRKGFSLWIIGTFPGMALFPFLLVFESITSSIFSDLGQLTVSIIATAIFALVAYLLLLTANILNGAILFNIPLGQAGKAAQFIFSLVSSYFLIALLFGAAYPIEVRVILVGGFVMYFAYSTTWSQLVPHKQAWLTAIAISSLMMLTTLLLSVWPIGSIYATLAMVVLLYVLLSIALEMREKVSSIIWVEYLVLVSLVVVILLTNGNWGIAGSII